MASASVMARPSAQAAARVTSLAPHSEASVGRGFRPLVLTQLACRPRLIVDRGGDTRLVAQRAIDLQCLGIRGLGLLVLAKLDVRTPDVRKRDCHSQSV